MSSTYSVLVSAPLRGVQGSRTFCALIVIPRSRSMSIRSRYWARMLRPSTMPVTSSIRSASVDLPWSMWAMMQKFRMRAGSVLAGAVTVPPSSHGRTPGTALDPGARRPWSVEGSSVTVTAAGRESPPGALRWVRLPPTAVATLCAVTFAVLVELAPVVGGDLAAQQWWASWASTSGSPVDLGWYGGVPAASYSLLSPWAGALLGLPLAGILGTVLGAASTTVLLGRLGPGRARWTAAGVASAATWAANEWTGRTTFGLGAALGCLALVVASGGA